MGLYIEYGLVRPNHGIVPVILKNYSPAPRFIHKDERICHLSEYVEEYCDISIKRSMYACKHAKRDKRPIGDKKDPKSTDKTIDKIVNKPIDKCKYNPITDKCNDNMKLQNITFEINPNLSDKDRGDMLKLLEKYWDRFQFPGESLGHITVEKHVINTGDAPSVRRRAYPVSLKQQKIIEDEVNDLLAKGVIIPTISSWASPVVLVNKRDGEIRFCVDYRWVNAVTKHDSFPMPLLSEALDVLGGHDTFSVLDGASFFWQIELDEG